MSDSAAAAFAACEAIAAGDWDGHLRQVRVAVLARMLLLDPAKPPPRVFLQDHQHWVWMSGPGSPAWEVRGTGLLPEPDERPEGA